MRPMVRAAERFAKRTEPLASRNYGSAKRTGMEERQGREFVLRGGAARRFLVLFRCGPGEERLRAWRSGGAGARQAPYRSRARPMSDSGEPTPEQRDREVRRGPKFR